MTHEQLDKIEKLLLPGIPCGGLEGRYASALQKTVKALREARAELGEALDELAFIKEEYGDGDPTEMSEDALMLKIRVQSAALDDLEQERARLAAEVERLRAEVERLRRHLGEIP